MNDGKFDSRDGRRPPVNPEQSLGELPTMQMDQKGIGQVDRYELLEKLGEGGYGAVYGARDTEAGILVALKALPVEVSCDVDEMALIRDNFALVSRLSHPNIAGVKHLHKVESPDERAAQALGIKHGDYLVVMEYAPGATLFAMRRVLPGRKMDFLQALAMCRPIAAALDYAHSQKVLHRDVKPKNVMVSFAGHDSLKPLKSSKPLKSGDDLNEAGGRFNERSDSTFSTVKVLDFGLAAEIRSSMSRKSKEPQNSKSGTPLYMAPEQWRGTMQNAAADQYALAVLFYELVGGEVPFKSAFDTGNFEIMLNAVTKNPVPPLAELTKKQNAVLLRALSKEPQKRFGSCVDFINALAGVRGQGTGGRGQKSATEPLASWAPRMRGNEVAIRNRKSAMLIGLLVVGLLGGGVWVSKLVSANRQSAMQQAQMSAEKQQQLTALLSAAESLFARSDFDGAGRKVNEALALDATNSSARDLRAKIQRKSGEQQFAGLLSAVESLVARSDFDGAGRKVNEALALDPTNSSAIDLLAKIQSKKEEQKQLAGVLSEAETLFARSDFDGAGRKANEVLALDAANRSARDLLAKIQSKVGEQQASTAKVDAKMARERTASVPDCKATQEMERQWQIGEMAWGRERWQDAWKAYQETIRLAGVVQQMPAYFAVQKRWNLATKEHKETQKEIEQYAAAEWTQALALANEAEGQEENPPLGKEKYEAALAKYAEAVKKAAPLLVPQIQLNVTPSGADVSLVAKGRSVLSSSWGDLGPRSGIAVPLEKGKTYTLTVSKNGYKTFSETLTADWYGLKEKQVVLNGWNLPPGVVEGSEAALAPLDGLAEGSVAAQALQKAAAVDLPLEVKSVKTGIAFRLVPAGSFTMGSSAKETGRGLDETQRSVTFSKPFYCGKFEVTQAQWQQVMGSNPSKFKKEGGDAPVEQVSWNDCQTFLKKLCDLDGAPQGTYRMLTESQWEYACRAGTTTPFCYGDRLDSTQANFEGSRSYGGAPRGVYRQKTVSAGQFRPNAWGLYDMHGNVWEWCGDAYGEMASGSGTYPAKADRRVFRGGSWRNAPQSCRSAERCAGAPGYRDLRVGIRLAICVEAVYTVEPFSVSTLQVRATPLVAELKRSKLEPGQDIGVDLGAGVKGYE